MAGGQDPSAFPLPPDETPQTHQPQSPDPDRTLPEANSKIIMDTVSTNETAQTPQPASSNSQTWLSDADFKITMDSVDKVMSSESSPPSNQDVKPPETRRLRIGPDDAYDVGSEGWNMGYLRGLGTNIITGSSEDGNDDAWTSLPKEPAPRIDPPAISEDILDHLASDIVALEVYCLRDI